MAGGTFLLLTSLIIGGTIYTRKRLKAAQKKRKENGSAFARQLLNAAVGNPKKGKKGARANTRLGSGGSASGLAPSSGSLNYTDSLLSEGTEGQLSILNQLLDGSTDMANRTKGGAPA